MASYSAEATVNSSGKRTSKQAVISASLERMQLFSLEDAKLVRERSEGPFVDVDLEARMRAVAPKLAALKERFGDDRQKMSQAMMELYKNEKINPLGGCLPILVQMPVFLALYWHQ